MTYYIMTIDKYQKILERINADSNIKSNIKSFTKIEIRKYIPSNIVLPKVESEIYFYDYCNKYIEHYGEIVEIIYKPCSRATGQDKQDNEYYHLIIYNIQININEKEFTKTKYHENQIVCKMFDQYINWELYPK